MTKISLAFGTALTLLFASCGQKNFLTGNDDNQPSGAPTYGLTAANNISDLSTRLR